MFNGVSSSPSHDMVLEGAQNICLHRKIDFTLLLELNHVIIFYCLLSLSPCILYERVLKLGKESIMVRSQRLQGKGCTTAAWLLDLVGVGISSKDCTKT